MKKPKYRAIGESMATTVDNTKRKDVMIKLPKYSQTFDIAALNDYEAMRPHLLSKTYRIYAADGAIKQEGSMADFTGTVRTDTEEKVRCEIGSGKWEILDDGYDQSDASTIPNEGTH